MTKTLILMNPVAGNNLDEEKLLQAVEQHFGTDAVLHKTEKDEDLHPVVQQAIVDKCELVIACGGDGTVSAAADALVNTSIPLGIVPVGTGNLLARELNIPLDMEAACAVIKAQEAVRYVDAMQVNGRSYISHISMGVYSELIEHTDPEHKQRMGRAAYVWAAIKELQDYPTWQFTLEADGKQRLIDASMVIAANIGAVGIPPLRWGPDIFADNGELTLCVVKAQSAADYFELIWHIMRGDFEYAQHIEYLRAKETAVISVEDAVSVRADGEIIGNGRVEIKMQPSALKVVAPLNGV